MYLSRDLQHLGLPPSPDQSGCGRLGSSCLGRHRATIVIKDIKHFELLASQLIHDFDAQLKVNIFLTAFHIHDFK